MPIAQLTKMIGSANNPNPSTNNLSSSTMPYQTSATQPTTDWNLIRFYLWLGAGFLTFLLLADFFGEPDTFYPRVWNNCWRIIYIVAANYLFYEYIVPRLSWRTPIVSVLLLVVQFFCYSFLFYGWRKLGIFLHIQTAFGEYESLIEGVCDNVPYTFLSFFVFGIAKHIYTYIGLRQVAQQLRIEKQEAELNYLKSQTNPHFLFNTLNNIYALAAEKSDLTPESILRLSEILRFMLYETNVAHIPIGQEIKIIRDYIALEQLRFDENLRVKFEVDVPNETLQIPPLLLIPLVENAFKHGAAETRIAPFVEIQLKVQAQQLYFEVHNSVERTDNDRPIQENIGLSNLRRQLELLYRRYELSLHIVEERFTAVLQIDLSSHV
jgi:two-component system, LytTR family, sensor kinase